MDYDPCENRSTSDTCDVWEAHFCCARCMALGLDDCNNCDPMDI